MRDETHTSGSRGLRQPQTARRGRLVIVAARLHVDGDGVAALPARAAAAAAAARALLRLRLRLQLLQVLRRRRRRREQRVVVEGAQRDRPLAEQRAVAATTTR